MKKYYVVTVEQTHDAQGALVEYGKSTQYETEKTAKSAFYDKCAAVNKDLKPETAHTFMDIKITDSTGGVIKKDTLGEYIDPDTIPTPEPETPAEETT